MELHPHTPNRTVIVRAILSRWELPPSPGQSTTTLSDVLLPDEARTLLIATLIHDFGMLSQKAEDLPSTHPISLDPSQWSEIASWVRVTHVDRLPKLLLRVMKTYSKKYETLFDQNKSNNLCDAIDVAMAHRWWPWAWKGDWQTNPRNRGLAAVVSVADLLDEDSARCDTETLLQHRGGDELNRAHWIRHALTANRVMVENGVIRIKLCKPPSTSRKLKPVYSALRNHFRLVLLYESDLDQIRAPITNIHLSPSTGIPRDEVASLVNWNELDGFDNESAFACQLLRTFMPEALKDSNKYDEETSNHLCIASLEDVNLAKYQKAESLNEPRTVTEQTFEAIIGGSE